MKSGKGVGCLMLLCVFLVGQADSQELKIERKERVVSYLQDGDEILKRWRKVEGGLYKAAFIVPPSFGSTAKSVGGFRFGKVTQLMIERGFQMLEVPESKRFAYG